MLISKLIKEKYPLTNSRRNRPYTVFAKALLFLFSVNLFLFTPAFAGDADDKIVGIQKAYEDIKDMSGDFVQKSFIKDLKRTETFKGQFFIKRPMKMKWSYKGDNAQDVLINNDLITIYQKKEKQAFKGKFDRDTYGQAPIALLSGFGKIREEFVVSDKKGKLVLKPKKPMGEITSIEIETAEGECPIKSFIINDSFSNRIEMTLKDVRINSGLKDTFFELTLPKGVTVFEQ
jgi:outer membrane lipoprotein carrier protein